MNEKMNFLDRNEFNFEPSDEVKEVIKNFDYRKLCFYTRIYDQGKKSIFSVYLSELYNIDEHQIILGYGAEDLLKKTVHYFLTLGGSKTMLIPKFSWWYYKSIADEVHGTTLQYPVYENGNTFTYDFEGIKKMVDELQPKILLVASPNNPTGNALTPAEMEKMVDMVPQSTILLVDEAYADFAKTNCVPLATAAKNRNVIVMRTLSKSFSLAGLRLGYCIGPEDLIDALYKVKDSYNVDALAQAVALAALNDLKWMRANVSKVRRTRTRVAKELARRGWDVPPSESNFLFVRPAHRPAAELFEALRAQNIFVRYFKGPRTGDRLRITIGTDAEMDTLLAALAQLDCD